jgi:hypothetical protein
MLDAEIKQTHPFSTGSNSVLFLRQLRKAGARLPQFYGGKTSIKN